MRKSVLYLLLMLICTAAFAEEREFLEKVRCFAWQAGFPKVNVSVDLTMGQFNAWTIDENSIIFGSYVMVVKDKFVWFIIAHELGHIRQLRFRNKLLTPTRRFLENDADYQAGKLLCSHPQFNPTLCRSLGPLCKLLPENPYEYIYYGLQWVCFDQCIENTYYGSFEDRLKTTLRGCHDAFRGMP